MGHSNHQPPTKGLIGNPALTGVFEPRLMVDVFLTIDEGCLHRVQHLRVRTS